MKLILKNRKYMKFIVEIMKFRSRAELVTYNNERL